MLPLDHVVGVPDLVKRRPIDVRRDSAGQMEVGSPDEGGIETFIQVQDRLLVVKKKAVYEVRLADDIDPERLNDAIPNTQQRILDVGTDSSLLQRTLLTAQALFRADFLPGVDCKAANKLAFEFAQLVLHLDRDAAKLRKDQERLERKIVGNRMKDGFDIPLVPGLDLICENYVMRSDRACAIVLDTARAFIAREFTHADSFLKVASEDYRSNPEFLAFLDEIVPQLKALRNARNAAAHPNLTQHLIVDNYKLGANGNVARPAISVVYPNAPDEKIDTLVFFESTVERLNQIYENLIAYLCSMHCSWGGFEISVAHLSPNRRGSRHAHFGYVVRLDDTWCPVN